MKKATLFLILELSGLTLAPMLFAADPGTTTAELLKIPIGARAVGMGEAYTALADDSSALEWNPAGLTEANQKEASFMHSSLIENINYEHLAFISPGTSYSAGASMSYLGYGSIAGYDRNDNTTGNQTAYAYVFNGGLATQFWNHVSAGVSASIVHEKLAMDSASTIAANLGAMYDIPEQPFQTNYRLGFSALNLGPGLKFVSERDPLPRVYKFGAAAMHVETLPLNFTIDGSIPNDNSPYLSVGSEYWIHELLALRLGYTGANTVSNGLRFGFGLKVHEILFDYAYGSFGDFGATHRIELAFRFGERSHQLNQEERSVLKSARVHLHEGEYEEAILGLNEILDKDPENGKILKQMIIVHEALLRKDLNASIAQAQSDRYGGIPDTEEATTALMMQGPQTTVAAVKAPKAKMPRGDDPLGLDDLPDPTTLPDGSAPAASQTELPQSP